MPQPTIYDIPDKLKHQTPSRLARMVQTMAALAALGGTSRQVSPAEVGRRVNVLEDDAKQALEDLVEAGYCKYHDATKTHYRIYA